MGATAVGDDGDRPEGKDTVCPREQERVSITEPPPAADALQPALRSGFQARLSPGVDMTSDVKSKPLMILHFFHLS
jgi:hypothetical protein